MARTNTALILAGLVALGTLGACGNSKKPKPSGSSTDTGSGGTSGSGGTGGEGTGGTGGDSGGSSNATGGAGGSGGGGGTGGAEATGGGGSGGSGGSGGQSATGGSGGTGGGAGAPPTVVTELTIVVSPDQDQREISPYIYGVAGEASAASVGATVVRHQELIDNVYSGYNWEINATHLGDRGGFENAALGSGADEGALATSLLSVAQANQGAAVLVVPMADIVAADATATDVTQSADYLTTRFVENVAAKGSAFENPPNTSDDFVYQDEFVNWVMGEAGSTPVIFALDHHPSLWELEQPVLFPDKASYSDIVDLTVEYATAIKDVWSEVEVSAPTLYGWQAFINLQNADDSETEGNFLAYYLEQMATAEVDEGRRLLDYLDVHWWPEVYADDVRIIGEEHSAEVVDARIQAPRSLWDSEYVENSWVAGGVPINLLGLMHDAIDAGYPGTKLALNAWYYGGASHISGALAAADVLGVLGREGVDLATAALPDTAPYALAGFSAFLDYDGDGGRFGDTSVRATTDDPDGTSAYASIMSGSEEDVVIVLINKRRNERVASIEVASDASYSSCLVYELTRDAPELVSAASLSGDANVFTYEMPALSLAVLVPQP